MRSVATTTVSAALLALGLAGCKPAERQEQAAHSVATQQSKGLPDLASRVKNSPNDTVTLGDKKVSSNRLEGVAPYTEAQLTAVRERIQRMATPFRQYPTSQSGVFEIDHLFDADRKDALPMYEELKLLTQDAGFVPYTPNKGASLNKLAATYLKLDASMRRFFRGDADALAGALADSLGRVEKSAAGEDKVMFRRAEDGRLLEGKTYAVPVHAVMGAYIICLDPELLKKAAQSSS